jgi:hypothetical protein
MSLRTVRCGPARGDEIALGLFRSDKDGAKFAGVLFAMPIELAMMPILGSEE